MFFQDAAASIANAAKSAGSEAAAAWSGLTSQADSMGGSDKAHMRSCDDLLAALQDISKQSSSGTSEGGDAPSTLHTLGFVGFPNVGKLSKDRFIR